MPIFFSVAAFIVIVLISEHNIAPKFRYCVRQVSADQATKHSNKHSQIISSIIGTQTICTISLVDRHNGFFSFLTAVVVAFFTGTLWVSTRRQAELTRQSIELGNKEFIATHRPRIRVRRIIFKEVDFGNSVKLTIRASNIGESSAKILSLGIDVYSPGQEYNAIPRDIGIIPKIPPGNEAAFDCVVFSKISKSDYELIVRGTQAFWMLGIISYEDENGVVRTTSFFRVFDEKANRFVKTSRKHPEGDREYED